MHGPIPPLPRQPQRSIATPEGSLGCAALPRVPDFASSPRFAALADQPAPAIRDRSSSEGPATPSPKRATRPATTRADRPAHGMRSEPTHLLLGRDTETVNVARHRASVQTSADRETRRPITRTAGPSSRMWAPAFRRVRPRCTCALGAAGTSGMPEVRVRGGRGGVRMREMDDVAELVPQSARGRGDRARTSIVLEPEEPVDQHTRCAG